MEHKRGPQDQGLLSQSKILEKEVGSEVAMGTSLPRASSLEKIWSLQRASNKVSVVM